MLIHSNKPEDNREWFDIDECEERFVLLGSKINFKVW